jgi:hypothetical protein
VPQLAAVVDVERAGDVPVVVPDRLHRVRLVDHRPDLCHTLRLPDEVVLRHLIVVPQRDQPVCQRLRLVTLDDHPGLQRRRRRVELPLDGGEGDPVVGRRVDERAVVLLHLQGRVDHARDCFHRDSLAA